MADLLSQYIPAGIARAYKRRVEAWLLGQDSTSTTANLIAYEAVSAAGGPASAQGALAAQLVALLCRDRALLREALVHEAAAAGGR